MCGQELQQPQPQLVCGGPWPFSLHAVARLGPKASSAALVGGGLEVSLDVLGRAGYRGKGPSGGLEHCECHRA